jgi:uncharacterized protein
MSEFNKEHIVEFEWDMGNKHKPERHNVSIYEVEEAFFDPNKVVFSDWKHSTIERRYILLGKTKKDRLLNIVYVVRKDKVRVITARDINKREVHLYEKRT